VVPWFVGDAQTVGLRNSTGAWVEIALQRRGETPSHTVWNGSEPTYFYTAVWAVVPAQALAPNEDYELILIEASQLNDTPEVLHADAGVDGVDAGSASFIAFTTGSTPLNGPPPTPSGVEVSAITTGLDGAQCRNAVELCVGFTPTGESVEMCFTPVGSADPELGYSPFCVLLWDSTLVVPDEQVSFDRDVYDITARAINAAGISSPAFQIAAGEYDQGGTCNGLVQPLSDASILSDGSAPPNTVTPDASSNPLPPGDASGGSEVEPAEDDAGNETGNASDSDASGEPDPIRGANASTTGGGCGCTLKPQTNSKKPTHSNAPLFAFTVATLALIRRRTR
jgi:hypothetical protein